jgi:hypothetical protein
MFSPTSKNRNKKNDLPIIVRYIKSINDLDTLIGLHKHLQTKKFNYLRNYTGWFSFSFWRGTLNNQHLMTTKTWAMIEKAISLQMAITLQANNRKEKLKMEPEYITAPLKKDHFDTKPEQLAMTHKFFTLKRLMIPFQFFPRTNASSQAFIAGDEAKLTQKYNAHFNQFG